MSAKSNPIASKLILGILLIVIVAGYTYLKNRNNSNVGAAAVIDVEDTSKGAETVVAEDASADSNAGQTSEPQVVELEQEAPVIVLGAEGDNTNDTIRTLNAKIKKLETDLAGRNTSPIQDDTLNQKIGEFEEKNNNKFSTMLKEMADLKTKYETLASFNKNNRDVKGFDQQGEYPITNGKGIPDTNDILEADPTLPKMKVNNSKRRADDEVIWFEPIDSIDSIDDEGNKTTFIPKLDSLLKGDTVSAVTDALSNTKEQAFDKPFATIPRGSTAIDTVSLTALIGRIPVGGQIVDPFKYKVLLSQENLASNGVVIDGIESAVVGGSVQGDYALSCVKGTIDYITFTFRDGTISSFPEGDLSELSEDDSLGFISDNAGIPCLSGQFITNGPEYLSQQIGITALATGAAAYADSQIQTQVQGETINSAVTGSRRKYVMGQMGTESLNKGSEWLSERQQNSFDAVYLPPATKLTLHFEKEIPINYNLNARRTNYGSQQKIFDSTNNLSGLF